MKKLRQAPKISKHSREIARNSRFFRMYPSIGERLEKYNLMKEVSQICKPVFLTILGEVPGDEAAKNEA